MDNTKSEIYSLKNISKNFKDFLNRIKDYGFFQRLFAWKLLTNEADNLFNTLDNLSDLINELSNNNEKLNDSLNNNEKLKTDLQEENNKNSTLREELAKLEATREDRKKSYESKMKEFDDMVTRVNEREKQKEDDKEKNRQDIENQRRISWQTHEDDVSSFIKDQCRIYGIEYIGPEEFPDKLKPDNSILISDRYVIFDAKSPKDSEDTSAFINGINTKVKQQVKYIKLSEVKKDIYLVVPSNLYKEIKKTQYQQGSYDVWIITLEQIPVMLAHFKETMDYNDFDGLSPEDRDALVKELGAYAFNLRRKLMIDGYFGKQFLQILKNTKNNLSEELYNEIEEAVKNLGDSLPTKRSGKPLSLDSVDQDIKEINFMSQQIGIPTPPEKEES
jgi:hypothetical protein|tara:strand:- start:53 stop:1219 length:1167 start_codon:yes stop_codon:yes gene_type:complete